jgi:hypothetical protein
MPRTASRLAATLLWVALALLPLRGLAGALMPVVTGGGNAPVTATEVAAMPCHGAAADDAGTVQDAGGTHTCSMCDLCHGTAMRTDAPAALPAAPHEPLPRSAALTPIEPRAPDGLYRPPRTDLA